MRTLLKNGTLIDYKTNTFEKYDIKSAIKIPPSNFSKIILNWKYKNVNRI